MLHNGQKALYPEQFQEEHLVGVLNHDRNLPIDLISLFSPLFSVSAAALLVLVRLIYCCNKVCYIYMIMFAKITGLKQAVGLNTVPSAPRNSICYKASSRLLLLKPEV